ncbi:MAG: TlpA disulfide reductase family protein [Bacteroidota bacterium]
MRILLFAGLALGLLACSGETRPPVATDTLAVVPFDSADAANARTLPSTFTPTATPSLVETMPSLTLETLAGETLSTDDLRGQVVLVNIWATWCGPCRFEIPDLLALQDTYGPSGLTILGLSVDEAYNRDAVVSFAEEMQIDYPVALVGADVVDQFGSVLGLPTTFVINRDGSVVQRINGVVHPDRITPMLEDMLGRD